MGPRVSILVTVWMVLVALWGCGGGKRIDQKFTEAPDKTEAQLRQDRYECMQRHDRLSNFIACMEARGYRHVK